MAGNDFQITQEAVHALSVGLPPASIEFRPVSLGVPPTRQQPSSASSTGPRRWLAPQAVGWIFAISDFVFICLLSLFLFGTSSNDIHALYEYVPTSIGTAGIFVAIFDRVGGYQRKQLRRLIWQAKNTVAAWFLTMALVYFLALPNPITLSPTNNNLLIFWLFGAPSFLLGCKYLYQMFFHYLTRVGYFTRNVVIIGAGNDAERLIQKIRSGGAEESNIRGLFDDRKDRIPNAIEGVPVRGTTDDVVGFVRRETIDEVLIALPFTAGERLESLERKLQALAIDVRLSIESLPGNFRARTVEYLGNARVLDLVERPLKGWPGALKVVQDKLLSVIVLICAGPLMLLIAALIKLDSRGPVLFVQERFGLNNVMIRVLKFRTMHLSCSDPSGQRRTVKNDPRVTRIGRILRKLSLDELPQLINVIRGDMSLVGPRPHAVAMMAGNQFYHEAVEEYPRRHRVKPGITGWAQVNGSRGEVDTLAKARTRVHLDLHYIDHWSLWLDVKILFKTAVFVISKSAY